MITLKSCPVCDSQDFTEFRVVPTGTLVAEIIPGVKVNAFGITRYCLCQDCNLIFQNPRLSDKELDLYYSTGFYRRTLGLTADDIDRDQLQRAGVDAEIIKKYIGKIASHMDVGCGPGYLLEKIGASLKVGVDPEVGYVKIKGIEVYTEMNKVPHKLFDLVTAIHVLEHVPKPLDYLKSMAKFVGGGGHLVIEVPTWKSLGGPLRLAHLHHFEPAVLKLICRQAGLRVIHEEFTTHLILICVKEVDSK